MELTTIGLSMYSHLKQHTQPSRDTFWQEIPFRADVTFTSHQSSHKQPERNDFQERRQISSYLNDL